jgi:hypothetical protein
MAVGYASPPPGVQFSSQYQPVKKRGPSIVANINKILKKKVEFTEPVTKEKTRDIVAAFIATRAVVNACRGNQDAIKDVMERVDGKTTQGGELTAPGDSRIILRIPKERELKDDDGRRINALTV